MATFFEVQKAALHRMEQAANIAEEVGFSTVSQFIIDKKKEMLERELVVVVAGEVKRGKSALLNALLNEVTPVCPVDADVCTNAVTVLRYGEQECIKVYIADKKAEDGVRIESIQRSEIADYVSETNNPNNFKNVFRIEVQLPNALLKEGVVFVDTPGVGSLNVEHAEVTFGFLPNADMLLFVTDTASVVSDTELNFLKRAYEYCNCVVYPLTKMDLNAEYEVLLTGNKKKISEMLCIPEEEVQMIPVSSKAKQRYLKKTDRRDYYENSNYPLLEETIWTTIAKRQAEVRIQPYLNETEQQLHMILDNIVAQYQVLGDAQVAAQLEKELQQKESEIEQLRADGANWKTQLQLYFTELQMDIASIRDKVSQEARQLLETRISELQTSVCSADNYKKLLYDINHKLICGTIEIRELLENSLQEKVESIRKAMDLNVSINQTILDKMNYKPSEDVTVRFQKKKLASQVIDKGRTIGGHSFGGTAIGGVLGGAIGGAIGFIVGGPVVAIEGMSLGNALGGGFGGAFGTAVGVYKASDKYDTSDINQVKSALSQHINSAMGNINTMISNVSKQLQILVTDSFDKELKLHIGLLQDNRKSIQEGLYVEKQEIPKKKKELEGKIDKVQTIFDKVCSLQAKIDELQLQSISKKNQKVHKENSDEVKNTTQNTEESVNSAPKKENSGQDTVDYGFM